MEYWRLEFHWILKIQCHFQIHVCFVDNPYAIKAQDRLTPVRLCSWQQSPQISLPESVLLATFFSSFESKPRQRSIPMKCNERNNYCCIHTLMWTLTRFLLIHLIVPLPPGNCFCLYCVFSKHVKFSAR